MGDSDKIGHSIPSSPIVNLLMPLFTDRLPTVLTFSIDRTYHHDSRTAGSIIP
jgi:hypothetical protein